MAHLQTPERHSQPLLAAPFHRQVDAFGSHLATAAGVGVRQRTLPGADPMSIMADLGTPGTEAANLLADLLAGGQCTTADEWGNARSLRSPSR